MQKRMAELTGRLREIADLQSVASLLHWDQYTYMPPMGLATRSRHSGLIERLAHERLCDPELGRLLDALRPYEESLLYGDDDAAIIREARRGFEDAVRVPPAFAAEMSAHMTSSFSAWAAARPANDFAAIQPYLEKTLALGRRYAEFFPGYEHVADPVIDRYDHGATVAMVRVLFAELREQLVPIVRAIAAQVGPDDSCISGHFPEAQQWAFALDAVQHCGYDLQRGRLDKTPHAHQATISLDDLRISTVVDESRLDIALYAAMHEAGHALYKAGMRREHEGTPLARSVSSSVDESQARLWENVVGRSRPFWSFFYPRLQAQFPQQLSNVPLETFYRAINKVQPTLIRVDADEVTYNLHVMLRFELELQLLEGKLAVRDLPEAWNERMRSDLGIVPPGDRDGVMQDVHWYVMGFGGWFQSYTLGNLMGAQFVRAALEANPQIPSEMAAGEFSSLRGWLNANVSYYGSKYTTPELVERATGRPLAVEPFVSYLRRKYGEIYHL